MRARHTRPDPGRVHAAFTARGVAWLVRDWAPGVDETLETVAADTYDLADRVHSLARLVRAGVIGGVLLAALLITVAIMIT